jgi:hypothetical protein
MATFKAVVFATHIKSNGTTNITSRVYHNSEPEYIPTPYYIEPKHMSRSGIVLDSYPDAAQLNFNLSKIILVYDKNLLYA